MSMRKILNLFENADFDQGHRNLKKNTHTFDRFEFQDKGRADTKMHNPGNYADNAMIVDEDMSGVGLERLHTILSKTVSDDEIRAGISLTPKGLQKVAAQMGCSVDDVPVLLASLRTKLNDEDTRIQRSYESFMMESSDDEISEEDERYSVESDSLGNVTIRDGQTGKQVFLQGSEASKLLNDLKTTGNSQYLLASYEHLMENDETYEREIESDSGSFNFDWKIGSQNGFGNASYSGKPDAPVIKLVRITDSNGDEIHPNEEMKKKLKKIAIDYMAKA